MKKLLSVFVLISMFSCNKSTDSITQNTNKPTPKFRGDDHKISIMAIQAGGCIPPAINCVQLPEVVVTAIQIAELDDVSDNGNASDVRNLFLSQDFEEIYGNLADELGDKLASGEYYIAKNYEGTSKVNYMVGTTYPVTFSNKEFVIEFNKE